MLPQGAWPQCHWFAGQAEAKVPSGRDQAVLHVVDAGTLVLPTGKLGACDPFVGLEHCPVWVEIPPGEYPVRITVADVSEAGDGTHLREAYLTLLVDSDAQEVRRAFLNGPDEGFGVDAGTACFVDVASVTPGMPDPEQWLETLFEAQEGWFERMDDPNHIASGAANIPLPHAQDGANIIVVHSGWGDGFYPVIGGYDADDQLVAVHIDFYVVGGPPFEDSAPAPHTPRHATEPRPNAALAAMLLPLGAWIALGLALEFGPGPTALGAGVVALAMTVLLTKKGWIAF